MGKRTSGWISYDDHNSTSGDGRVTYSTTENNNGRSKRTTTGYISGTSDTCTVNIEQNGRPLYVYFEGQRSAKDNDARYSIGNAGGTVNIHGKTNAETLTFSIGSGAFITLDSSGYHQYVNGAPEGNYIVNGSGPVGDPGARGEWEFVLAVTVAANGDTDPRTASVELLASDGTYNDTATAYIDQAAAEGYVEINDSPTGTFSDEVTLVFSWNDTTSKDVYVHSNEQWTVSLE